MAATHADVRPSPGSWILRGAGLGLVAGVVFAMFEMIVSSLMGKGFWMPLQMIAGIVLGEEAMKGGYSLVTAASVGGAVHMVLSALYGAVFGAVAGAVRRLRESAVALIGAATIYGFLLWIVNFFVIAPAAFPWFEKADDVVQFVAHSFFYGAVLGILLTLLSARAEKAPARSVEGPLHRAA